MRAHNYHSYTHVILAMSIVREPVGSVAFFVKSKYSCALDIGRLLIVMHAWVWAARIVKILDPLNRVVTNRAIMFTA